MPADIVGIEGQVQTLNAAMVSIATWGGLMTIAVVVLAIVVYRRWRRNQYNTDGESVVGSHSGSDLSDLSSALGSMVNISELDPGSENQAYTVDEEQPPSDDIPEVTVTDSNHLPTVHQSPHTSTALDHSSQSISIRL